MYKALFFSDSPILFCPFYELGVFIFKSLNAFNVTINVAPISAKIAIHNVNHPGMTSNKANNLIPREKMIFSFIIVNVFRLN